MTEERLEGFKNLLNDAKIKAEKESGESELYPVCEYISDWVNQKTDFPINERTFVRKYNAVRTKNNEILSKTRGSTIKALCKFVGYNSFKDYLNPEIRPYDSNVKVLYGINVNAKITMLSDSEEVVRKCADALKALFNHPSMTINEISFSKTVDKQFAGNKLRYAQKWLLSIQDKKLFYDKIILIEEELKPLNSNGVLPIKRINKNGKIILFDASGKTNIYLEIEHSKDLN